MSVEVFFNRPGGQRWPVERMIADIVAAPVKSDLMVASAWFTHVEIAKAIVASKARSKLVLLNGADLSRDGSNAAVSVLLERRGGNFEVRILGDAQWHEGVMHHKVVVIAPNYGLTNWIAWVGSANLTYQALKNYENIIRFQDELAVADFWNEFQSIGGDDGLWVRDSQGEYVGANSVTVFRCGRCGRIARAPDDWEDDVVSGALTACRRCAPDAWDQAAHFADFLRDARARGFDTLDRLPRTEETA